jgi:ketosteroid isomerase-like protein
MTQENVDVVRRSFDAWNQNDWEQLQAIYAPDVIVIAPREWPEPEGARGWEEWRLQIKRLKESWEVERVEVDEIRALPDGRVFARVVWAASGLASGIRTDIPIAIVSTIRDGQIRRIEYFLDSNKALEAAGLSE